MNRMTLFCLIATSAFACATPATTGMMPMQPAPSHPAPLASTCACGGDKLAPDHATHCPCAGHQSDEQTHTCGCGTGPDAEHVGAETPIDP